MTSAVLCFFDSFLAALGIGLHGYHECDRRKLILAFATFDFSATLAGVSLHSALAHIHYVGSGLRLFSVVAALGVAALAAFAFRRKGSGVFLCVPVVLSVDNFITGLVGGSMQAPTIALIAGLASGLAAWAGFVAARDLRSLCSQRIAVVASASLLILALVLAN